MASKFIPVVLGTARAERKSETVAKAVVKVINKIDGISTELFDVREHVKEAITVPPWGVGGANEVPTKWKETVQKSHALILVVPEYNHSFPGELKLLLDSLWDDYQNKAVGLVGVSSGSLGGARVVDHLKPVLIELKLHPIKEAVHISKAAEAVNESGDFVETKNNEYVEKMVTEIGRLSDALASLDK